MKTEDFVKEVAMKMKEIVELNKEWNPNNEYVSLAYLKGHISFNTDTDEDENGERNNYITFWTDELKDIEEGEIYSDNGINYHLRKEKK
jgi:hypothetical protein